MVAIGRRARPREPVDRVARVVLCWQSAHRADRPALLRSRCRVDAIDSPSRRSRPDVPLLRGDPIRIFTYSSAALWNGRASLKIQGTTVRRAWPADQVQQEILAVATHGKNLYCVRWHPGASDG